MKWICRNLTIGILDIIACRYNQRSGVTCEEPSKEQRFEIFEFLLSKRPVCDQINSRSASFDTPGDGPQSDLCFASRGRRNNQDTLTPAHARLQRRELSLCNGWVSAVLEDKIVYASLRKAVILG